MFAVRLFWYLATLAFFACGLMSKPMLVTLRFVLLLLDEPARCKLGFVFALQGDLPKAVDEFKEAVHLCPADTDAQRMLAKLLFRMRGANPLNSEDRPN
jgi:hypothetical protein